AGKLLLGTDGPWLHPGLELEKIKLLRLPADQQAKILGGNAVRLLARRGRSSRLARGEHERVAVGVLENHERAPVGRLRRA
ncbi:MAG TPA: amidohydrolase family protein, partial [Thermoanaerobaculia bacterium]